MAALVSLKANCYVCDRPFVRARKLRSHLFHQHGIDVEPRPSGKRRYDTQQFMYIKKASDASHSLIAVHYECPSCFGHYAAIDELKAHVTVHVRNTHHGSKKRNAPTSGEEPNDDFGFDSSSSAQERTIICKKTKVSYLGSHDDPPPEVQEPPDIESDEEGTGLGLRSMLFLWAYRLRESKPIEGIDAVIKTRKVDLASFTGRLIGISIDIMQKWQSENYLDEKLKETLSLSLSFIVNTLIPENPMKTLFGQRTWENFIKVGEIDEVDVLPKPVEKLVLEIEKTLALEGELACIKQLAKLKAELVDDSIDSLAIQVIDVYEFIVRHIKKWKIVQRNQITEMYYLQVFHQVISILLRDTNLVPVIGEKASKVTKAARELHGKFLDDCHKLNIYGRKVDLLLSVCDIELGANEWKTSSSEITLIRQQSKNVRVNKCILEELTKNLSENGVNVDDCHLLCMDWNEFNGYMYIIKNVDDITVASLVRQLMIPTHFKEVPWFRETLACLLHYKKHYSNLASKLEDAMLIQDRRLAFHNIVESLSIPSVRTPSPSVYLSPKRGK